jgi:hypothetical protein
VAFGLRIVSRTQRRIETGCERISWRDSQRSLFYEESHRKPGLQIAGSGGFASLELDFVHSAGRQPEFADEKLSAGSQGNIAAQNCSPIFDARESVSGNEDLFSKIPLCKTEELSNSREAIAYLRFCQFRIYRAFSDYRHRDSKPQKTIYRKIFIAKLNMMCSITHQMVVQQSKRGRKKFGSVRHPGLCSNARMLRVTPGHLLAVIEGKRTSPELFEKYRVLTASRQNGHGETEGKV